MSGEQHWIDKPTGLAFHPAPSSTPPARGSGRDETREAVAPTDRDRAIGEGLLARMYAGMSDEDVVAYVAEALAAERAYALSLPAVRRLLDGAPEWQCPSCGATTRARMADQ